MRLFGILLSILTILNCGSPGKVQGIQMNPAENSAKLAIGFLENRHTGFRPFPVKNFKDMLEFELMEQGYGVLDYSPTLLNDIPPKKKDSKERAVARVNLLPSEKESEEDKDAFLSRSNGSDDLFPPSYRSIAGERETSSRRRVRDRLLTAKEIEKLSSVLPFDFFVQGAVGTTERNLFSSDLDEEGDSLVFLKIYNPAGKRVGAIRFFVEQKSYSRPAFLRDVSRRIVQNFRSRVDRPVATVEADAIEPPDATQEPPGAQDAGSEPAP